MADNRSLDDEERYLYDEPVGDRGGEVYLSFPQSEGGEGNLFMLCEQDRELKNMDRCDLALLFRGFQEGGVPLEGVLRLMGLSLSFFMKENSLGFDEIVDLGKAASRGFSGGDKKLSYWLGRSGYFRLVSSLIGSAEGGFSIHHKTWGSFTQEIARLGAEEEGPAPEGGVSNKEKAIPGGGGDFCEGEALRSGGCRETFEEPRGVRVGERLAPEDITGLGALLLIGKQRDSDGSWEEGSVVSPSRPRRSFLKKSHPPFDTLSDDKRNSIEEGILELSDSLYPPCAFEQSYRVYALLRSPSVVRGFRVVFTV